MRRMSAAVLTARGTLLEKYGHTLWVRFGTPVRIVDARPRHRGPNYLGWVHVDGQFTDTVRWISEPNFNRFYRETTNHTDGGTT